jgi:8-oxo-dGTP pyrophosphatase MutT (NUDIX family)
VTGPDLGTSPFETWQSGCLVAQRFRHQPERRYLRHVATVPAPSAEKTLPCASLAEWPLSGADTDRVTETPSGVAIVVWRRQPELEVLLLHRSAFAESFVGDWAWTTPGGASDPGEPASATAARELFEETGLKLTCNPVASRVAAAQPGIDLDVFAAEAFADPSVRLSDEHDRYEWVQPDDLDRCQPAWVKEMYREVLELVSRARGVPCASRPEYTVKRRSVAADAGNSTVVLGEFFAARKDEIDEALLEAPYERLETVEAKGLSEINLARLGEILDLGTYDDLVGQFDATGPSDNHDVGLYELPRTFRDVLAGLADVGPAARRWVATEELQLDEWQLEDGELVLREVSALARRALEEQRDLWYWWSL